MGIKWDAIKGGINSTLGGTLRRLSAGQPEPFVSDVWISDVTQIAAGDVIRVQTSDHLDFEVVIVSNENGFITTTMDEFYSHSYLQWRVDEGLVSLTRLYRGVGNVAPDFTKYPDR